jgi:hypothetical protein
MAAQKSGDLETARQALARAVASPTRFVGRDEAERALSTFK